MGLLVAPILVSELVLLFVEEPACQSTVRLVKPSVGQSESLLAPMCLYQELVLIVTWG